MPTDLHAATDPIIDKIIELLTYALPLFRDDQKEFAAAYPKQPPAMGQPFPDPGPAIAHMREHLQGLRADVLAQVGGSAAAATARELTALTLLQSDQSLEKLQQSYAAPNRTSANSFREQSIQLVKLAKTTSIKAGTALGIPWPL